MTQHQGAGQGLVVNDVFGCTLGLVCRMLVACLVTREWLLNLTISGSLWQKADS